MNLLQLVGLKPKIYDPNAPQYADIYGRAVAGTIDLALVFYCLSWLFNLISVQLYWMVDQDMLSQTILAQPQHKVPIIHSLKLMWQSGLIPFFLTNRVIEFVVIGIYWVGCQAAFQTTPGKWLMGYRVAPRSAHDAQPSLRQYLVRYLAYFISCGPFMIGLFLATFNRERRAVHDRIAGTVVLSTRPSGWYVAQVRRLFGKKKESTPVE